MRPKGSLGAADFEDGASTAIYSRERAADVHIYYVEHTLENCSATALDVLTPDDCAEFAHLRHFLTRARSLMARAVLRRALAALVDGLMQPAGWIFVRSGDGKPCVAKGQPQVFFNCTHTAGLSAVAVSASGPVGIDIASTTCAFENSLADMYLSQGERRSIDQLPAVRRPEAFSRFWALKESYLKLNGIALSEGIRGLDFDPKVDCLRTVSPGSSLSQEVKFKTWYMAAAGRHFSAALAVSAL